MDRNELIIGVTILDMVLRYGAPLVLEALAAMEKDEVTLQDIQELRERIRPPEQYFQRDPNFDAEEFLFGKGTSAVGISIDEAVRTAADKIKEG